MAALANSTHMAIFRTSLSLCLARGHMHTGLSPVSSGFTDIQAQVSFLSEDQCRLTIRLDAFPQIKQREGAAFVRTMKGKCLKWSPSACARRQRCEKRLWKPPSSSPAFCVQHQLKARRNPAYFPIHDSVG